MMRVCDLGAQSFASRCGGLPNASVLLCQFSYDWRLNPTNWASLLSSMRVEFTHSVLVFRDCICQLRVPRLRLLSCIAGNSNIYCKYLLLSLNIFVTFLPMSSSKDWNIAKSQLQIGGSANQQSMCQNPDLDLTLFYLNLWVFSLSLFFFSFLLSFFGFCEFYL